MVVLVTIVCAAGAAVAAALEPTVYTGRAALTAASQTRSPEQDAYLAQGYAEYFNQSSYQESLRVKADIPPGLTYNARTAATSPIIYVEASGPVQEAAVSGAAAMADAFRNDVNAGIRTGADQAAADLRRQINDLQRQLASPLNSDAERSRYSDQIENLQSQLTARQADNANDLTTLQRQASFSSTSKDPVQDGLLGLVGGLILGSALALLLAGVGARILSADDVRDRLGLDTLAVIRGGRGRRADATRAEEMKGLANVVGLSDFSRPLVIAVTTPRTSESGSEVALGLAGHRASQGERVLVVDADLRSAQSDTPGVADVLGAAGRRRPADFIVSPEGTGFRVLPSGLTVSDPYALFGPERFVGMVNELRWTADLIVIDAPPVVDAAESQVICAAADRTILVLDEDTTRVSEADEACQLLDRVHADMLGAVVVRPVAVRRTTKNSAVEPHGDAGSPAPSSPAATPPPAAQPPAATPPPTVAPHIPGPTSELRTNGSDDATRTSETVPATTTTTDNGSTG